MANELKHSEDNLDPRTVRFRKEYQGKHFFTKDGEKEFVITDARSYGDVDIEFIGSGIKKNTKVGNIKNGLPNPFVNSCGRRTGRSIVAFDTPKQQYEGSIMRTNEGYNIKILEYRGIRDITYQILDEFGYIGTTTIQNAIKGQIRNPYHRNAVGGYLGIGPYRTKEFEWLRNIWYGMLTRATGKRAEYASQATYYINVRSYEDLCIDPSWFCYSTFADWYMSIYPNLNPNYIYNVDKDLLYPYYKDFTNRKKCYSPNTCIIMPKLTNVEIANYAALNEDNKSKIIHQMDMINTNLYKDGALDLDTYNVIRRFYVKDPNYQNYITTRYESFKYMNLIYPQQTI